MFYIHIDTNINVTNNLIKFDTVDQELVVAAALTKVEKIPT